jgi:signal transduction histidine kinase
VAGTVTNLAAAKPPRAVGFWVFYFITWVAVGLRFLISTVPQFGFSPVPAALLGAYLVLGSCLPWIATRRPMLLEPLFFLQAAVTVALILLPPHQDFYAVLFLGIALVSARYLPYGHDVAWVVALCALPTAALILSYGVAEGFSYLPTYIMGVLILGFYGRAARRAEDARAKSEALLAQLGEANRELQRYAEQAERTAAAEERERLARELHDAATQTVFSINLTAEAARLAIAQDPGRLPGLLDRIQESSAEALAEMRSLVSDLRPRVVSEDGLLATLRQHFVLRERRERLRVIFSIEGEEHGSTEIREALFRTVQEALNNVVKHSGAVEAEVALAFSENEAMVRIRDGGCGFAADAAPADAAARVSPGGFGLAGMRRRVEEMGGTFTVTSAPGAGTTVTASLPLAAEA